MAKTARGGINVDKEHVAKFHELIGPSRTASGCLAALIDWIGRQGSDIHPVLFDKISQEAEIKLLEMLLQKAKAKHHATPRK